MTRPIIPGATDQSTTLYFVDSTTGLPKEGLTDASAGLALWYRRQLGAKTAITPAALAALTTAHTDGGFEEIDDGAYRVDLPDAAVASGSDDVTVGGSATGAIAVPVTHALNFVTPANIQSECEDALVAKGLDHLVSASVTGTDIADNSIVARLVSKSATADWDSYDNTTDSHEAIRNKETDIETDTQDLQTQVGTAGAGLTAINLPDQTMNITGNITGNLSGSVGSVTGAVGSVTGAVGSVTGLTASNLDATVSSRATPAQILTTALSEAYAADGVTPTLSELLFLVQQSLHEFAIASTTRTVKKLDKTTTAATFTLDDASNPTSTTRAT